MSSNYETLYGVGLLDDLHNYFPALLYDSGSFGSVREVLGYIQAQTRNRFDLFSYGQREYLSAHPPPAPPSVSSVPRTRTSFASMPPPGGSVRSTLLNPMPPSMIPSLRSLHVDESQDEFPLSTITQSIGRMGSMPPTVQVNLHQSNENTEEEEEEEEEEVPTQNENRLLTNALLSLLQLPEMSLTRNFMDVSTRIHVMGNRNMDQFLQPVVVRPTPEQIELNTTVGHLVSDTDQACAICQDTLTGEQDGRKLNACGHWFHKNCIDTWLERDVHCPVCRHDIREPLRQTSSPIPPV